MKGLKICFCQCCNVKVSIKVNIEVKWFCAGPALICAELHAPPGSCEQHDYTADSASARAEFGAALGLSNAASRCHGQRVASFPRSTGCAG